MSETPSTPKDVADMLEAIAKRLRKQDGAAAARSAALPTGIEIISPPTYGPEDDEPNVGAVDVFADDRHVTVTIETRNIEASSVHVSVAEGRLMINLGEGPSACRRDLPLPAAVDEEHAYATFRNGILDVVLPRRGIAHAAL